MPVTIHLSAPLKLYYVMYEGEEGVSYDMMVAARTKHQAVEEWRGYVQDEYGYDPDGIDDPEADNPAPYPDRLWLVPGVVGGAPRAMGWDDEVTLVDYP